MRGYGRLKDGVLSHVYDPRIHQKMNRFRDVSFRDVMDCRVNPGNDEPRFLPKVKRL
jgi:hypothetical protein